MAFSFEMDFAGVPFVSDESPLVREYIEQSVLRNTDQMAPRKHQPLPDLIDEINRLIPFRFTQDLAPNAAYPGPTLGGLAQPPQRVFDPRLSHIQVNEWYYPTGASRFSVFRGLAISSMVKAMIAAGGGVTPETFTMKATPQGNPNGSDTSYNLVTSMYMLPPRSLSEMGGNFDGLYLVTLVDDRYYFQGTPATLHPSTTSTWTSLINQVATNLGITLTINSAVEAEWGTPSLDSPLWTNLEDAGFLLDALAANVGRVVVRNLNGTYTLYTPAESAALVATNRGAALNVVRTAGGEIFASGQSLPVGDTTGTVNAVVPATINVTFPKYVYGGDPVPHYLNPHLSSGNNQGIWHQESYGDVYSVAIGIASGGANVSGRTGTSQQTVRATAKAMYSTEAAGVSGGTPDNVSGLTALAMKVVVNRYDTIVAGALDEVYPGTFAWTPEGINDLIWTYSPRRRLASTRVVHSEWNSFVDQGQWATPLMAGATLVSGVGGKGVAQTWRDIGEHSGTVMLGGINLVSVGSGLTASGGVFTSGGVREIILSNPNGNTVNQTITNVSLTSDTYNNYQLPSTNILNITPIGGPVYFTGFTLATAGTTQVIEIRNAAAQPATGAAPLTISMLPQNNGSLAANQISTPNQLPYIQQPGETTQWKYVGGNFQQAEAPPYTPYTNAGATGGGGGGGGMPFGTVSMTPQSVGTYPATPAAPTINYNIGTITIGGNTYPLLQFTDPTGTQGFLPPVLGVNDMTGLTVPSPPTGTLYCYVTLDANGNPVMNYIKSNGTTGTIGFNTFVPATGAGNYNEQAQITANGNLSQANATALTGDICIIESGTATQNSVILPNAAQRVMYIVNRLPTNPIINVFPQTGGTINQGSVNGATTMGPVTQNVFWSAATLSGTAWFTIA